MSHDAKATDVCQIADGTSEYELGMQQREPKMDRT